MSQQAVASSSELVFSVHTATNGAASGAVVTCTSEEGTAKWQAAAQGNSSGHSVSYDASSLLLATGRLHDTVTFGNITKLAVQAEICSLGGSKWSTDDVTDTPTTTSTSTATGTPITMAPTTTPTDAPTTDAPTTDAPTAPTDTGAPTTGTPSAAPTTKNPTSAPTPGPTYAYVPILQNGPKTWSEARTACRTLGGDLATIRDGSDNAAVTAVAGTAKPWIGLHDQVNEDVWTWVDGQPLQQAYKCQGAPLCKLVIMCERSVCL